MDGAFVTNSKGTQRFVELIPTNEEINLNMLQVSQVLSRAEES